ncbi:MAG: DUF4221 domain-containing protein [Bacteroidales bacterium]|nr:DUF4221 domain-containing protein [Bacteroidales bacterium]
MNVAPLLHVALLFIFLPACKSPATHHNKPVTKNNYSISLVAVDTISFNLPPNGIFASRYIMSYFDPDRDAVYLLRQNRQFNCIEKYNLNSEQFVSVNKFDKVGPNGIGKINGFYPISSDLFLLGSLYRQKLFYADTNGIVKNTTEFPYPNGDYYFSTSNPLSLSPEKKTVQVSVQPMMDRVGNKKMYFESPVSAKLFLDRGCKIDINNMRFPKIYIESNYSEVDYTYFTRTSNALKGIQVFSFPADPSIYTEDSLGSIQSYYSPSQYFKYPDPVPNKQISWEEGRVLFLENPRYESIAYDAYKNIYYRFCLLAIEIEKGKKYSPYIHLEMPFTVIVLDSAFNTMTEKKFEKHLFNTSEYFITSKGLWISANNPENPNFDEERLRYVLFALEKN